MVSTLNMQDIRHLNLFNQVTKINTRYCINYNGNLIFAVPKSSVMRAVGENARNLKRISEILKKRIRVIPIPRGIEDAKSFIGNIVSPVTFKDLEITDKEIILNAGGTQNKAALIGRDKRRLIEMQKIIEDFFGKEFRIA
jgi:NusA-like KH domain protein